MCRSPNATNFERWRLIFVGSGFMLHYWRLELWAGCIFGKSVEPWRSVLDYEAINRNEIAYDKV
jgi:hypothetical protein